MTAGTGSTGFTEKVRSGGEFDTEAIYIYIYIYIKFMLDFINNFYVLLTVHLSIILGNDQLDTHLLYFTIRLL